MEGSGTMCRELQITLTKNINVDVELPNFISFNSFLTNVPILYRLKTPENQRFSGVFRGYKMGTLARNGLMLTNGDSNKGVG